jgi:glycine C-acetyltransferase/8-amino-7-oxononanoate synthase
LHLARHGDPRDQLWEAVAHFRDGVRAMGYQTDGSSQIVTVQVPDQTALQPVQTALRDAGVLARAIAPAQSTDGTGRIRLTPLATHDSDDVVACLETLQAVGEDLDVI